MGITIKDVDRTEYLSRGNLACGGCGAVEAFRLALKTLGPDTMAVTSTGCLAVVMQMGVPRVAHAHVLFENGPAVMSGMDAALDVMGQRKNTNLLVMAGDGGTADIGLSALSGAVERNQDFVYVCYDNESYMNTGGQRSGTTPWGAATTTTPIGKQSRGEDHPFPLTKNVAEMMVAQGCPYVAMASIAYPFDFMNKIKRAAQVRGPSYVQVHAPCCTGWLMEPRFTVKAARLAVQTGLVQLWEEDRAPGGSGVRTRQHVPSRRKPVVEYMKLQGRFKHLLDDAEALARWQSHVDRTWEKIGAAGAVH